MLSKYYRDASTVHRMRNYTHSCKVGEIGLAARKVLVSAAVAAVAHDQLVTLTKARQQTNTPNTHTLSPLTGAWFMVGLFAELSLEVGFYNNYLHSKLNGSVYANWINRVMDCEGWYFCCNSVCQTVSED